jgi:hypothetical protein
MSDPMTLEEFRSSYDWEEVFKYAQPTIAVPGSTVSTADFTREDVVEILGIANGDNDGPDWVGVFRLSDGRVGAVIAGCDYTGWG